MSSTKVSYLLLVNKKSSRSSSCLGSWFWISRWNFSLSPSWKSTNLLTPRRIPFTHQNSSKSSFSTFKNKFRSQSWFRILTLLFRKILLGRSLRKHCLTPRFLSCKSHKLPTANSEINSKLKDISPTSLTHLNSIKSSTNCLPKRTTKVNISINLWPTKRWEPISKSSRMGGKLLDISKETSKSFQIWEANQESSARKWLHSCLISRYFTRRKGSISSWSRTSMTK